jgi:hypothetical protein
MESKSDIYEGHAWRCEQQARAVHVRILKGLLLDLAKQWRELAATARSLSVDAQDRDDFFKRVSDSAK